MVKLGDIGTSFEIEHVDENDAAIDISTATTIEVILRKPDETEVTKTASFVTDGTDGKTRYTSTSGDIDQTGNWMIRGHIVLPSGEWKTDWGAFRVEE